MIHDLCVIMLTAGITSLLFKLFRQPVVLGYIVAGIIAGPYVCGQSWIDDTGSVDMWGEIGVLFLLFAMGLEFSFKKLLQVGSTALIAAGTVVIGMMSVGFLVGLLLGWNEINSLFLGGMLCMSSTTIVFKAIEDMKLGTHKFAKVAFGILIVEDLFAVVLMVLLSSIAVKQQFEGKQMLMEVGKLVGYLVLWFVVGIAVIPTFLKIFRKHLNDETLTIFAIGMCLGMVLLAINAGFSSALGAFVMGSVLAETLEAERIEHLVQPIKNIFGAIFFVSVGMMINPELLVEYWLPILVLTFVVILGQISFSTLGTLLSGQSLRVSLQTGFCLVQIGEFAFIIANFGQSAGVTDTNLYPIVVAVSVITTFLTPYIMRLSGPAEEYLTRTLSPGVLLFIENYSSRRNTVTEESSWNKYIKKIVSSMLVSGILLVFLYIIYFNYVSPFILSKSSWFEGVLTDEASQFVLKAIALVILFTIAAPFIYNVSIRYCRTEQAMKLWSSGNHRKATLAGIFIFRIIAGVAFISYAILRIFTLGAGVLVGISLLFLLFIMFSRRVKKQSHSMEERFMGNLTAREVSAEKKRAMSKTFVSHLLNYDLHISDFTVPSDSSFSGKTLSQLGIRGKTGVSIVRIIRGGIHTNIPGGGKHVYPGDQIVVAGTDEQIEAFKQMLDGSIVKKNENAERTHVTLERFTVTETSSLVGKTIIDSHIRDNAECIVMGIERDGEYIMNPEPSTAFMAGDVVIVAGETEKLRKTILLLNG